MSDTDAAAKNLNQFLKEKRQARQNQQDLQAQQKKERVDKALEKLRTEDW
jgi:hypothetical protein